jgi:hypothetical protein
VEEFNIVVTSSPLASELKEMKEIIDAEVTEIVNKINIDK